MNFSRAEKTKVGKGRDMPNQDPYLAPPIGRYKFTLNPFELMVTRNFLV